MNQLTMIIWLMLLATGLAVWVLAIRRWRDGQPMLPRAAAAHPPWPLAVVGAVAVWIGWQVVNRINAELGLVTEAAAEQQYNLQNVQVLILLNGVLIALLMFLLTQAGQRRLEAYGIHARQAGWNVVYGLAGFLASLPPVVLVFNITAPLREPERLHPFVELLQNDPSAEGYVWVAVAVIVAAPLAEELVFRVILQGALRSRLSATWSIAISSVVFAGVHGFPDSLALLPLAVVLGYVFEQRRSYLAVVVLHALFNARTLLFV